MPPETKPALFQPLNLWVSILKKKKKKNDRHQCNEAQKGHDEHLQKRRWLLGKQQLKEEPHLTAARKDRASWHKSKRFSSQAQQYFGILQYPRARNTTARLHSALTSLRKGTLWLWGRWGWVALLCQQVSRRPNVFYVMATTSKAEMVSWCSPTDHVPHTQRRFLYCLVLASFLKRAWRQDVSCYGTFSPHFM